MNFDIITSDIILTLYNFDINYAFEFTYTVSSAGGTLIYVANHLAYKSRTDFQIYNLLGIYFY